MKKLFYVVIALFAVTACQKDPDLSNVEDQYLVYTTYKYGYDFTQPYRIYIPDYILLVGSSSQDDSQWDDANAQAILDEFTRNLGPKAQGGAGYTIVTDPEADYDLALNVSYIENTTVFVDYPYWWWDPYWWDGGYWPGWYYPYPVVYGYTIGSLVGELVQPGLETLRQNQELPTVWYTYISGAENGSEQVVTGELLPAVDQAFAQSPYLNVTTPM